MSELTELLKITHGIEGLNFFPKKWGFEYWFANTKDYCGKKLYVMCDVWSSDGNFHYHKVKDETFYVLDGILILNLCDYQDEIEHVQSISLLPGQSIRLKPRTRHRFTAADPNGCSFIEASTHHEESDSYRCRWEKDTYQWVDYDPNKK